MSAGSGGARVQFKPNVWALLAIACGAAISFAALPLPASFFAALLAALAIAIAIIDIEFLVIPDVANIALFVLGIALTVIEAPPGELLLSIGDALLRSFAAGGTLFALRLLYLRFAGVEGLGLGDVKLATATATLLQWPTLPIALLIGAIGGLVAIGSRGLIRRQLPDRAAEIPFGAFLAPAIWLAFMLERYGLPGF